MATAYYAEGEGSAVRIVGGGRERAGGRGGKGTHFGDYLLTRGV